MPLKPTAKLPKCETLRNGEITRMRHRRILHRTDVAVGEYQPVALFPIGLLRVVRENMKIKCGEDVRHAERPRRVPAPPQRQAYRLWSREWTPLVSRALRPFRSSASCVQGSTHIYRAIRNYRWPDCPTIPYSHPRRSCTTRPPLCIYTSRTSRCPRHTGRHPL